MHLKTSKSLLSRGGQVPSGAADHSAIAKCAMEKWHYCKSLDLGNFVFESNGFWDFLSLGLGINRMSIWQPWMSSTAYLMTTD